MDKTRNIAVSQTELADTQQQTIVRLQPENSFSIAHRKEPFFTGSALSLMDESGGVIKPASAFDQDAPFTAQTCAGCKVLSCALARSADAGVHAQRYWIAQLPNILIIADSIAAKTPLQYHIEFSANNCDGKLAPHIFDDGRVVLRRGDAAMKLLPLLPEGMPLNFSYSEQAGSLSLSYTSGFQTHHIFLYAILLSEEAQIPSWHGKQIDKNKWKADDPSHSFGFYLTLEDDILTAQDIHSQQVIFNKKL